MYVYSFYCKIIPMGIWHTIGFRVQPIFANFDYPNDRDMKHIVIFLSLFLTVAFGYGQSEVELITQEKDLGVITNIKYSPSGKYLASGSDRDDAVKIWDVQSGKLIGTLKGHRGHINDVSFSPDGNELVSCGQDDKTYRWNLNTWEAIDSIADKHPAKHVAFIGTDAFIAVQNSGDALMRKGGETTKLSDTPKSAEAVSSLGDKLIIAGGKEVVLFTNGSKVSEFKHKNDISSVRLHTNLISVGDKAGQLAIYSLDGELKSSRELHKKAITSFDFHPEKKLAVTSSADKTTIIWNTTSWEKLAVLGDEKDELREPIKAIQFSPDGNTVASSSYSYSLLHNVKSKDNSIKIWNARTGKLYKELKGAVNPLQSFSFHPGQNILYTIQNDRLSVWDMDNGERGTETRLHDREVTKQTVAEKINDDAQSGKLGKGLGKLKGLATGKIGVGDLDLKEKGKEKSMEAWTRAVRNRALNYDRFFVSDSGNYIVTNLLDDDLRLYTFEEDNLKHITNINTHQETAINDVSLDPNEKYIALAGSGDRAISIIDMTRGSFVKTLSTEKANEKGLAHMEARALSFNRTGTQLAAMFNSGLIMVWDVKTWELLVQVDLKGGLSKHAFLNYSRDGEFFFVPSLLGVFSVDAATLIPLTKNQPKIKGDPIMTHVASDYIVSLEDKHLNFLNVQNNQTVSTPNFNTDLIVSMEFNMFGYLGVGLESGELRIYDPETGEQRLTMVSSGENAIFKTKENYYKATKEGASLVTFRVGKDAFPFEQFDAKFNRPDLVLKAMNSNDEALIDLYNKAYKKRLKKLGLSEADLNGKLHLPELKVTNAAEIPLVTDGDQIQLKVAASDSKYELKTLNVWINDVPMFGAAGKEISGKSASETVSLNLVSGLNKVQVSCVNSNGSESYKHTFDIDCTVERPSDLYIISIGTSKYANSDFNLDYAAKDAKDMAGLYSTDKRHYKNVFEKILTDEEVTRLNVMSLKSFLKDAKINDVVMVFIAGHGVLDSELDYFYGTHNIDFGNPSVSGLRYDQIEAILDGIKPLRKILIMDTCHSGEVEKDEVEESTEIVENTEVTFRAVGPGLKQKDGASPTRMMNEMFNDLRRGTGTTVISSAGGAEYAIESDVWKNGLFTYCFLDALKNKKADINNDGVIMLSEMQSWVRDEVVKLSKGAQSPTTRIQNIALDYKLW